MKTAKLIGLLVLIAVAAWNCSSPVSSNDKFSESPYTEASRVSQADSIRGLAQQIPGFGGLFIDHSGQLCIYLTHPDEQKAKARAVLSNSKLIARSLSNKSASVSNMKFLKCKYTYLSLYEWKKEVADTVFPMEGVYSIGIDESRNKVSLGVENKAVLDKVIEKLSELDIPGDAVMMYQMTPPQYY